MPLYLPDKKPYVIVGSVEADYLVDGTADQVQIQAAIDAVNASGGGMVFIKEGTYNLATALTNKSNVEIVGEEKNSTILKMGNNLNTTVFNNSTEGLTGVTVKNLTVDGNGANQTSGGGGLVANRINDLTIEKCVFKQSYNFNILIGSGTGTSLTGTLTFTLGDTTVTGSGTLFTSQLSVGLIIKTAAGKFVRVTSITSNTSLELDRAFEYTTESGVSASSYTGNLRCRIINCDFQGSLNTDNVGLGLLVDGLIQGNSTHGSGGGYGFGPDHCFYTKFIGNACYENDNDGIGMETCAYCEVIGNECYESVSGNGIRLLSGSYRNIISNNICRKNVNGMNITYNSTSFGKPDENTITGNICELNTTHGIRIGGSSRNNVADNRCANNGTGTTAGIVLTTDTSVTPDKNHIANNYCYDNQDTKTQNYGIWINNGTGNYVIDNYSLTADHVTAGLLDSGTNTVVINTNGTTNNAGRAILGTVNIAGDTMTGDLNVPDEVYGTGWNGSTEVPTKNAIYDKIQTIASDVLFDHFADVNNSGTTETDLYSDTLAAGQLANNGEKIILQAGGIFVGDATSTQQLRAYFGGTLIFDTGALGVGIGTTNWDLYITIIRVSASVVRCSATLNTSFASLAAYAKYTEVTGLTLANTQILETTGTAAGATGGSNQITAKEGYCEFKPSAQEQ